MESTDERHTAAMDRYLDRAIAYIRHRQSGTLIELWSETVEEPCMGAAEEVARASGRDPAMQRMVRDPVRGGSLILDRDDLECLRAALMVCQARIDASPDVQLAALIRQRGAMENR